MLECTVCSGDVCVREKKDSLGRSLYARQCGSCGSRVGDWISHHMVLSECPPWVEERPVVVSQEILFK